MSANIISLLHLETYICIVRVRGHAILYLLRCQLHSHPPKKNQVKGIKCIGKGDPPP